MKSKSLIVGSFIGLVLSVSVGAEPLLEGQVRLSSGQPAAGVQVRLFDLSDLRRFVGTTTDETGHFALPLRAFSTARGTALPADFALGQNYPNPFNPSTIIPYQLPTSAHVRLEVFNMLGQRLATLVDGERSAGMHTAQWDATDAAGRAVGAGVYIYRLSSGGMSMSGRMVLVDGQAGVPLAGSAPGPLRSVVAGSVTADQPVYGLTVSGAGMVAYVNPDFRVGIDTASIVVEPYEGAPRMKLAAGGVLGDVNNDGQVDLLDLLFVMLYSTDSSIMLPNNGDISLGDVNEDGRVNSADAVLLIRYFSDPFDPALPLKLGRTEVSLGSSTASSLEADEADQFFIEISSSGSLVVYTTGSTDTYGSILDSSGNVLASNDDGGEGLNFQVSTSVSAGTYYIAVDAYGSGDYTLHVRTNDPDLVVASSVNDSTLAFGQPFTLRATVRNQGGGELEPTVLFYYRSTDATVTSDDTQIHADVVNLGTSNTTAKSLSLTAPEAAGTYYYGACVQSVSGEHNTDNNCSDAVRVTVSSEFVYTPPTDPTFSRIYWTDWHEGTISRANLDGSNIETLITGLDNPHSVALDITDGKMYWVDYDLFADEDGTGKIQRANLDGSNIETLVATGSDGLFDIALDVAGGKMYWVDYNGIHRANLDGSNIETLVPGGVREGIALDVAGNKIYWTDYNGIHRANLDGSNIETLVTGLDGPAGIALDVAGGKMYWADEDWSSDTGKIQRANLDGSNIETLITGLDSPDGIALYLANDKLYWTEKFGTYAGINRANLDGSNIETLVTGLGLPGGIALGP